MAKTIQPVITTTTTSTSEPYTNSTTLILSTSSAPPTTTSVVAGSSTTLTGGAIGGIVAGIVAGFLILSGTIFLIFRRRPPANNIAPVLVNLDEEQSKTDLTYVMTPIPQVGRLQYPEELHEIGGRTAGDTVGRSEP